MNVVLAANPRRKRRRKPKQKTKKRPARASAKRPAEPKKRRRAKAKKTKTTTRKRPARKTEKTMARKRRKSGSRRKRTGGKRRMTKKQRAAALRNLAKGRRKASRRRKSGGSAPKRRRRRAAAKAPTTRRRRRSSSRKGRRHTKWKSIKPYRRKASVGGHRRRTNPDVLLTAGLAVVGVGAGILASRAADKFLPASLSPTARSGIKLVGAVAGGVGGFMLSPALGLGFGAALGAKGGDELVEMAMGPSAPAAVAGLGAIYRQLPSPDTQLEAIYSGQGFGAIVDDSVDLDELAFEEAG